jgi:hypothetical protein
VSRHSSGTGVGLGRALKFSATNTSNVLTSNSIEFKVLVVGPGVASIVGSFVGGVVWLVREGTIKVD